MLKTVTGIGPILAMTIALEVGEIGRFAGVGEFASYCRCVDSQRLSNGKKKGEAWLALGRHRILSKSYGLLKPSETEIRLVIAVHLWTSV